MTSPLHRREFLAGAASAAAVTGLGDFRFLQALPPVRDADVPNRVQLAPDIEPLVRFLEETPRNRLLEEAARRIHGGTSYQQMLAALFLAGVRNVRPRPVGFQFHTVLSVWSAHQAAIAAQDRDRWLPLFWAIDNFKSSEARDRRENNFTMAPLNESRLPSPQQAKQRFTTAMDNWDRDAAEAAVASFVRTAGADEVIETFWRYGARDFRSIGHKVIFVANGSRALQVIGWRHAEPIMRSLADALVAHDGENPARRNDPADVPYRENLQRLRRIREGWQRGRVDAQATRDLLAAFRRANPAQCCQQVVSKLNNRIDPASVWDALFLIAGEHLMRRPGIVGIHCVTTANALYHGYRTSAVDETRRLLMLQAAAFMAMFRDRLQRGRVRNDVRIDSLEPLNPTARGGEVVEEILADINRDKVRAAQKTLALLHEERSARARSLMAGARRLLFTKGNNAHDYKFSSAALEDFYHATPAWRDRFLATAMFNLRGAGDRDNDLIGRARTALNRNG